MIPNLPNGKPRLEFPEIDMASVAFGAYPQEWFDKVLEQATEEGLDSFWEHRANTLFFSGGKVEVNKKLDSAYTDRGLLMLNCVLGSFRPKHEYKSLVAGKILESLCSEIPNV